MRKIPAALNVQFKALLVKNKIPPQPEESSLLLTLINFEQRSTVTPFSLQGYDEELNRKGLPGVFSLKLFSLQPNQPE